MALIKINILNKQKYYYLLLFLLFIIMIKRDMI
jgi:hypothetical protein